MFGSKSLYLFAKIIFFYAGVYKVYLLMIFFYPKLSLDFISE